MSNYILHSKNEPDPEQDHLYLIHSAKGSTWKKNTKYIDRVWKNGKWIYVYKEKTNPSDAGLRDPLAVANTVAANAKDMPDVLKRDTDRRKKSREQYLKDTQEGRNRERQARELKGKTSGVVNSKANKTEFDSVRKTRENAGRIERIAYKPVGTNVSTKKNANKKFVDKTVSKETAKAREDNSKIRGKKETRKYTYENAYKKETDRLNKLLENPYDSIADTRFQSEMMFDPYQIRQNHAKSRSEKTKKLNRKSYQLINKASGVVRTAKKKLER